jgi:hypothetical protein
MRKALRSWRLLVVGLVLAKIPLTTGCGGGGGSSSPNGPPSITSLSPSSATAGAAGVTLTINGTNFVSGATVTYSGVAHIATFGSSTQLTVSLSPSDLATPGPYPVIVTNPSGGGSSNAVNFSVNKQATSGIPASFFGMHVNKAASFPLQVSYGSFRDWDINASSWQTTSSCVGHTNVECQANPNLVTYTWTNLDQNLSNANSAGIKDGVLYTLSRTPLWASSNPTGTGCLYGNGTCYPPVDMNADGSCSGTNSTCAIWDNWVTSISNHVNNSTYRQTHAHVQIWEAQNEIHCDSTINGGASCGGTGGTKATWAELLRMNEDTRCILKGVGTIHNYPTAGNSASCSSYLSTLGQTAIDVNALVTTNSDSPAPFFSQRITQNYLYCNNNPSEDLNGGTSTSCTWSGGLNWGSSSVDIINFHFYITNEQPENDLPNNSTNHWISSIDSWLTSTDKAKPLINGEGSCGQPNAGLHIWNDNYSMAGYVSRYLALLWSAGINQSFYYSYDGSCVLWNGSGLTPAGTGWNSTYNWLAGATPVNSPFCSNAGTIWTCPFIGANGKPAELVWDSQFGPGGTTASANCASATNLLICGDTAYTVPTVYQQDWVDIKGNVHPFQLTVTVGAVPILLE